MSRNGNGKVQKRIANKELQADLWAAGITQQEIAEEYGCNRSFVSMVLSGDRDSEELLNIARRMARERLEPA